MMTWKMPVFGGLLTLAASLAVAQSLPLLAQPTVIAASQARSADPPKFFKATCSQCHDISVVTSQRHTRRQWSELVDKMTDLGLVTDDENLARIKSYLAETYPAGVAGPKN